MGRILVITAGLFFLAGLCSCQPEREIPSSNIDSLKTKESGKSFPDFLVGTWKADNAQWIFHFEPDGRISSFRHYAGMNVDVSEGGASEEWPNGTIAAYFLGPCEANYTPATRQLNVSIIIEYFYIDYPTGRVTGSFSDYLRGPVSQNGKKWKARWLSYLTIDGAEPPDPNKIRPKTITFSKIQGNNQ